MRLLLSSHVAIATFTFSLFEEDELVMETLGLPLSLTPYVNEGVPALVQLNDTATIVERDYLAYNGIVHIIDQVVGAEGSLSIFSTTPSEAPSTKPSISMQPSTQRTFQPTKSRVINITVEGIQIELDGARGLGESGRIAFVTSLQEWYVLVYDRWENENTNTGNSRRRQMGNSRILQPTVSRGIQNFDTIISLTSESYQGDSPVLLTYNQQIVFNADEDEVVLSSLESNATTILAKELILAPFQDSNEREELFDKLRGSDTAFSAIVLATSDDVPTFVEDTGARQIEPNSNNGDGGLSLLFLLLIFVGGLCCCCGGALAAIHFLRRYSRTDREAEERLKEEDSNHQQDHYEWDDYLAGVSHAKPDDVGKDGIFNDRGGDMKLSAWRENEAEYSSDGPADQTDSFTDEPFGRSESPAPSVYGFPGDAFSSPMSQAQKEEREEQPPATSTVDGFYDAPLAFGDRANMDHSDNVRMEDAASTHGTEDNSGDDTFDVNADLGNTDFPNHYDDDDDEGLSLGFSLPGYSVAGNSAT